MNVEGNTLKNNTSEIFNRNTLILDKFGSLMNDLVTYSQYINREGELLYDMNHVAGTLEAILILQQY